MYCPVFNLAGRPDQLGESVFIHCGTCLVPGTTVIIVLILPNAPGDVWALLLQRHHQGQGLVVKPCIYNIPIRQVAVTCPNLHCISAQYYIDEREVNLSLILN